MVSWPYLAKRYTAKAMRHRAGWWTTIFLLALIIGAITWRVWQTHRGAPTSISAPAAAMDAEPRLMLWAWETPGNLTALDASKAGVAFLAREVLAGDVVAVRNRAQPLHTAPGAWLMAVVRIETAAGFVSSPEKEEAIVRDVTSVAAIPNVRGVQIDFDATASQQAMYARLIRRVRAGLPASIPLSITALVNWCGSSSWLAGMPVDEAVPMFFRMGGPAALRNTAAKKASDVREPLCSTSMGVATDETWPAIDPRQRLYLFRTGPWTARDINIINTAAIASSDATAYEQLRGNLSHE